MQKAHLVALNIFFFLGERIALIILVILAVGVLSIEKPAQAFSADDSMPKITTVAALTVSIGSIPTPTNTPIPTQTPTPPPGQSPSGAAPTPTPIPPTPTPTIAVDSNDNAIWDRLAQCESGGNWSIDTGNGYFGGLQFNQGAWSSVGGTGIPSQASRDEQIAKGKALQSIRGWGAWGECANRLGLN